MFENLLVKIREKYAENVSFVMEKRKTEYRITQCRIFRDKRKRKS